MLGLKAIASTLALAMAAVAVPTEVDTIDEVFNHTAPLDKRAGQQMVAIWSKNSLIVADLGGGTTAAHGTGFNLFNDRAEEVYSNGAPTGYIPCWGGRREFTLSGGCFVNAKYKFYCEGDPFTGAAEVCAAKDEFDHKLGEFGHGSDDVIFFAVGSGTEAYCAVVFSVAEGINCGADGGLSASEHNDDPVFVEEVPCTGLFC